MLKIIMDILDKECCQICSNDYDFDEVLECVENSDMNKWEIMCADGKKRNLAYTDITKIGIFSNR